MASCNDECIKGLYSEILIENSQFEQKSEFHWNVGLVFDIWVDNVSDNELEPGDIKLAVSMLKKGDDINYEGAAGSQEIDAQGDVNNTIEVWTIKDGKVTSTGQFLSP